MNSIIEAQETYFNFHWIPFPMHGLQLTQRSGPFFSQEHHDRIRKLEREHDAWLRDFNNRLFEQEKVKSWDQKMNDA